MREMLRTYSLHMLDFFKYPAAAKERMDMPKMSACL